MSWVNKITVSIFISSLGFGATNSGGSLVVQKFDLSQQNTSVEFLAVGKPSLLKINGTGGKLVGQIEIDGGKISGEFKVYLNALSTGVDLRDKHMKEKYLETGKFPEATFTISKINLPNDFVAQKKLFSKVPFEGKMKIKGSEKDIQGLADVDSSGANIVAKTEFKSQLSTFQIEIPSYLGIKLADEVTILTSMSLKR
jgi:polyisoprenoid-binding protein YceI